jgi:hypothetical protein
MKNWNLLEVLRLQSALVFHSTKQPINQSST